MQIKRMPPKNLKKKKCLGQFNRDGQCHSNYVENPWKSMIVMTVYRGGCVCEELLRTRLRKCVYASDYFVHVSEQACVCKRLHMHDETTTSPACERRT